MDSGHYSERDYTELAADEMQVEVTPLPSNDSGEVEMQPLDDSTYSNDNNMMGTEPTSASTPSTAIPATSLSESFFSSSSSTPLSIPSMVQRTSMRRSRVEDDHDSERDRRHPSHRVGSPSHPSNSTSSSYSTSPSSSQSTPIDSQVSSGMGRSPGPSHPISSPNSRPFRFFQHMFPHSHTNNPNSAPSNASSQTLNASAQRENTRPAPTSIPAPTANVSAANSAPSPSTTRTNDDGSPQRTALPNLLPQIFGGFAFAIDVNGAVTTVPLPGTPPPASPMPPHPNANTDNAVSNTPQAAVAAPPHSSAGPAVGENPPTAARPETGGPGPGPDPPNQAPPTRPHPEAEGSPPPGGPNSFADLLARIGLLAALSFQNSALFERELEDPERAKKLVEGLEDVPVGLVRRLERVGKVGVSNEESSESGGGLGDGGCAICWERLLIEVEEGKEEGKEEKGEKGREEAKSESMDVTPTQAVESSSLPAQPEKGDKGKQYQRIVALPCAHVFHAQCLVPWFSKPKQTTCPICRFNIDPGNLTYTRRSQRRAQAQTTETGGDAATEGGQEQPVPPGLGPGLGEEPSVFGLDIPLVVGGPPIIIPIRPGGRNAGQPTAAATTQAADSTTEQQAPARAADDRPNTATGDRNTARDAPADDDRIPREIVTIGFDMYIGRGPPPFPFQGPGVIHIPMPGAGAPRSAPPPAANTAPIANAASSAGVAPSGPANPNVNTPTTGADERNDGSGQGRDSRGTTFAIPIPMSQGLGRALGDIFSRIFGSGPTPSSGPTPGPGTGPPPTGPMNVGSGGQPQAQGPVVFGPERPPAPPSRPLPFAATNIGIGVGQRQQVVPPIVLPFGMRGATGQQRQPEQAGTAGQTGRAGQAGQAGQTGQAEQGGVFESIPLFDIITGMFAAPPQTPAQGQAQGQGQPQTQAQPGAQPAQPQPRRPQDINAQPGGFNWGWMPGSPPPRPSPAPAPRQQPRKKWTPPPAPGLTLRQRVEKKEQEAGLRCCDVSCGVGPSDEDPWVDVGVEQIRQLSIQSPTPVDTTASTVDAGADGAGKDVSAGEGKGTESMEKAGAGGMERKAVCPHTFHSSCLVSAERVSLALRDAEVAFVGPEGRKEVEVSCPVCRGVGRVSKEEWDAGVQALR